MVCAGGHLWNSPWSLALTYMIPHTRTAPDLQHWISTDTVLVVVQPSFLPICFSSDPVHHVTWHSSSAPDILHFHVTPSVWLMLNASHTKLRIHVDSGILHITHVKLLHETFLNPPHSLHNFLEPAQFHLCRSSNF